MPYGYVRVLVPDGVKQRPKLEVAELAAGLERATAEALRNPVLSTVPSGGPGGTRTPDLLNAIQSRSQLRHRPVQGQV